MSSWQDWVIFGGQLVLAATLIPTIVQRIRMPVWTALPAVLVLSMFVITFASLSLPLSMASSILNTLAWALILRNSIRK